MPKVTAPEQEATFSAVPVVLEGGRGFKGCAALSARPLRGCLAAAPVEGLRVMLHLK